MSTVFPVNRPTAGPQGALGVISGGPPGANERGPLAKVKQVSRRDPGGRPHLERGFPLVGHWMILSSGPPW